MNIFSKFRNRYFFRSRVLEVKTLFQLALGHGYRFLSHKEYLSQRGSSSPVILVRHDVDSDPVAMLSLLALHRELGVSGSVYFRNSTADHATITATKNAGLELGYHYEQISVFIKKNLPKAKCLTDEDQLAVISEARKNFRLDFTDFRQKCDAAELGCAAHGDWVNRKLGISNEEILRGWRGRESNGVLYDAYDTSFNQLQRTADRFGSGKWSSPSPHELIKSRQSFVLLLHTRKLVPNLTEGIAEDVTRIAEGLRALL